MTIPLVNVPPLPPLGNDLVRFLTDVELDVAPDAMGEIPTTPSGVDVPHCRHRALPATSPAQRETPEDIIDVATQVWQTHAPVIDDDGNPIECVLNAKVTDAVECNGITYQIVGGVVKVTGDSGAVEFVKFLSKVQGG